jgi:uncharacterized protein YegP (UPF0339 family)
MTFYTYLDADNQWRWYLMAGNGRKIANGGEGYFNYADCLHAIGLVKGSSTAQVVKLTR